MRLPVLFGQEASGNKLVCQKEQCKIMLYVAYHHPTARQTENGKILEETLVQCG